MTNYIPTITYYEPSSCRLIELSPVTRARLVFNGMAVLMTWSAPSSSLACDSFSDNESIPSHCRGIPKGREWGHHIAQVQVGKVTGQRHGDWDDKLEEGLGINNIRIDGHSMRVGHRGKDRVVELELASMIRGIVVRFVLKGVKIERKGEYGGKGNGAGKKRKSEQQDNGEPAKKLSKIHGESGINGEVGIHRNDEITETSSPTRPSISNIGNLEIQAHQNNEQVSQSSLPSAPAATISEPSLASDTETRARDLDYSHDSFSYHEFYVDEEEDIGLGATFRAGVLEETLLQTGRPKRYLRNLARWASGERRRAEERLEIMSEVEAYVHHRAETWDSI